MLYAVAVMVSIILIALIFVIYSNKKNQIRLFDTTEELTAFLYKKYTSEIKHHQPIHGIVLDDASIQKSLQDSVIGDLGCSAVDVQVNLITKNGYQEVNAPCGNVQAKFKKGDLVVVLPTYNDQYSFWYYVTIAKLQPIYDEKNKSWIISENYLQS